MLDASAILAVLRKEPGADRVLVHVGNAIVSAVNLQEAVKELTLEGIPLAVAREMLGELRLGVVSHDADAAYAAGALASQTKRYGRGLGDRSCMALGIALGATVVTADREWRKVEIEGLTLEHVR